MLLTAGERVSMSLLAMALHERGVPAISFTGSQSGIITSSEHGRATIVEIRPQRIREELGKGKVVIIAGFQGVSQEKEITTLGRGGSDTTAVALAAALGAQRCEVLTDVEGIFSADPRIVPNARLISALSYDQCLEMASLGAKMQARSIELAKRFGVRVWIGSSQGATRSGTEVGESGDSGGQMEKARVTGIATKEGFAYFSTSQRLKEVASWFQQSSAALRFVAVSNGRVNFLVEDAVAAQIGALAKASDPRVTQVSNVAIVSVVGEGLSNSPELLARCLEVFAACEDECLLVSSNSLSLTVAVPAEKKALIAQELHARVVEE
jgi:aspartate kinase